MSKLAYILDGNYSVLVEVNVDRNTQKRLGNETVALQFFELPASHANVEL